MENKNYDKAVEHFANGLSLINPNNKLLNKLSKKIPMDVCKKIQIQIQEIQTLLPKIKII